MISDWIISGILHSIERPVHLAAAVCPLLSKAYDGAVDPEDEMLRDVHKLFIGAIMKTAFDMRWQSIHIRRWIDTDVGRIGFKIDFFPEEISPTEVRWTVVATQHDDRSDLIQ